MPKTEVLQWDPAATPLSPCDVTSVTQAPEGLVVSFGRREQGPGGEWHVRRMHQVLLDPAAAAGLRQMLARMLADHQGGAGS